MVIPQGDCQPAFPGTFWPQLHPTHIPAKHALGLDPRVDTRRGYASVKTIEARSGVDMTNHVAARLPSDEAEVVARARAGDAAAVRIVMNEALGRLRGRRPPVALDPVIATGALEAEIIPFPNANPELDPETAVAQRELRALLECAIDELPESFRTVLVARLIEGMSVEETAELLGIVPETVKTRLHRARRLLRGAMEKHIGPAMGDAFPFAGRRCERVAENVIARLGLA
jgi:RNA polymerase sigma-70 factor (ECF subfamily)